MLPRTHDHKFPEGLVFAIFATIWCRIDPKPSFARLVTVDVTGAYCAFVLYHVTRSMQRRRSKKTGTPPQPVSHALCQPSSPHSVVLPLHVETGATISVWLANDSPGGCVVKTRCHVLGITATASSARSAPQHHQWLLGLGSRDAAGSGACLASRIPLFVAGSFAP